MLDNATYNLMETATVISKGLHRYGTFQSDAKNCQDCQQVWNEMKQADEKQLAKIVGAEPLPRSEVTKKVWAHIKKHKLQNPQNKREILADDKLQPIFGSKKLDMFQMTKAVNKHLK